MIDFVMKKRVKTEEIRDKTRTQVQPGEKRSQKERWSTCGRFWSRHNLRLTLQIIKLNRNRVFGCGACYPGGWVAGKIDRSHQGAPSAHYYLSPPSSKMASIGTLYLSEQAVATSKVSQVVVGVLGLD